MLNNTMSTSIIEFCKQQFSRHGIPDILMIMIMISDNGPQLKSSKFTEFAKLGNLLMSRLAASDVTL